MRKIFPVAIVAIGTIILFASCNKDYTCTCTVTGSGVSHVISSDIGQKTKSNAQEQCTEIQTNYTDPASGQSAACHL